MAGFAEDVVVEEDNVVDTEALAGSNGLFEVIPCAGSVNACGIEELAVSCVVTLAVEITSGVVNRPMKLETNWEFDVRVGLGCCCITDIV